MTERVTVETSDLEAVLQCVGRDATWDQKMAAERCKKAISDTKPRPKRRIGRDS